MLSNNDPDGVVSGGEDFRTLEKFAEENLAKDAQSDVIEAVPPIYMRATIYIFGAVVIASLVMTYLIKVYVIVQSKGSIMPEGQSVVVEAESPGVITELRVSLGDKVEAGQTILELRQDSAGVGLTTLQDQLKIQSGNAEKAKSALDSVNEILANPQIISEKSLEFFRDAGPALVYIGGLKNIQQKLDQLKHKERVELTDKKLILDAQVKLQKNTIKSLKDNENTILETIETTSQSIERKKEELKRVAKLAQNRVLTDQDLNTARDSLLSAQSSINQQRQALSETRLSINRARVDINNLKNAFVAEQRELQNSIDEAKLAYDKSISDLASSIPTFTQAIKTSEAQISEITGKLKIQKNTIDKLVIKSPVNGEIASLNFNSKGQIVGQGNKVAVIIPTDVRPIIMVEVPNKDIAGVQEGVGARVKVNAYPFRQYGTIPAEVTRVFPRLDKPSFYVQLRLERNFIKVSGKLVPLEPGLGVEVDLLTKRKRILQLIFNKMR